jgi:hypothetical protein
MEEVAGEGKPRAEGKEGVPNLKESKERKAEGKVTVNDFEMISVLGKGSGSKVCPLISRPLTGSDTCL